jgi:Helicase conserved C-terminal domain
VRTQKPTANLYSSIYFNLQKSYRTLSLTGTPIYNDIFDLLYQINLVAGKTIVPFNHEVFRLAFTKIDKPRAYWRGHLLESLYIPKVISLFFPFLFAYLGVSDLIIPIAALIASGVLSAAPMLLFPIHQYPLRHFNPAQLKTIIKQYISYYNFDLDSHFYPTKSSYETKLFYNAEQLDFLYKFCDNRLSATELTQLLKDTNSWLISQENIQLNGSIIQDAYKRQPGAGREIGNLLFTKQLPPENNGKGRFQETIFPEKFKEILHAISRRQGPAVIYSHYYQNGLLLFKQFLDTTPYKEKYRIIYPEMSADEHGKIINEFNNNQIKILLLHPDITEGISLMGASQLHFLDMPINSAMKQQIIGRVIRYRSHLHLPETEQHVEIYTWQYVLSILDMKSNLAKRKNWQHNFSELNYYSQFGVGRDQVDPNALLKNDSPDERAYQHLNTISLHIKQFREHLERFSIEN